MSASNLGLQVPITLNATGRNIFDYLMLSDANLVSISYTVSQFFYAQYNYTALRYDF